jgi:hypothetical protein
MPGYIKKTLFCFGHVHPSKPQMQPHSHTIPTYGATVQYAKATDSSPAATKDKEKYIPQVIGVLLYYGRAVDSTILVNLSSLAAAQAKPTKHTVFLIKWLLDYAATNSDAILTYKKNHGTCCPQQCLLSQQTISPQPCWRSLFCSADVDDPPNNGAVLNISKILKAVMSSAAKARLGALYINAHEANPI